MTTATERKCLCGLDPTGRVSTVSVSKTCPIHGQELWTKIQTMAPRLWCQIAADAEPLLEGLSRKERLEGMVELVLDANRPEQFGLMTKDEYRAILDLPPKVAEKWAAKGLACYA
jgi:hypothetical protein